MFTMEYDKINRFPNHDSDAMGAIFMCNNFTKKECFRWKLFGLPSVHSDFVKQIKTGMILFLFEPDERKLNGIFQATSNGAMNIVPSAFSSSKKSFPAQVRFERLCACRPLFENEFSDAIKENYFTAIKFSFALSGQQVCRLIWLFSSKSYLPYDKLPGVLQSFMKLSENSHLARTRVTGNEILPKYDAAGYTKDNNIQPTKNSFLLGRSKNHLISYKHHYDKTLQNHMARGQHEPYSSISHSAKLKQHNLMPSTYCNDLSRDAIPVIPSGHPSYSSSRFLYKQPSVALGTDSHGQKLTFRSGNSLDAITPHIRNQSHISTSHIGIKDFLLSNYPGIDISKPPCFSKPSSPSHLTSHAPEDHANFHDFRQNSFHDSYDLSNNKFLHSSPERLQAMASTSLCLRSARSYCRPIQHKDDSWNIQGWSSHRDYIPISEGETMVNSGYIPVLEDDLAYAKESFELPSRKENSPLALQYDYNSGFTTDNNNTRSFDFSYNDKNSASDLITSPQSNTFQKRRNVFYRLSRPPKKSKYPSLDHMMEAFYHQRSQRTKVCRGKLENLESFETDVPLDNIGELGPFENDSLVDVKAQFGEFDHSSGFSIPNFKRRSVVKQQNTVANDFTGCVDKCKRRKIIRPTFSEEDNFSQVKKTSQNLNLPYASSSDAVHKGHDELNISCTLSNPGIKGSLDFRIEDIRISKMPAEELSFSMELDSHVEGPGSAGQYGPLSNTDSLTVNIQGSQQTLDCDSEGGNNPKFVAKETEKIIIYNSLMCDENVDGEPKENPCALLVDFIPLSVEKEEEASNSNSVCIDNDIASDEVPEKDAAKHTARNSLDSDMNCIVVKMIA